MPKIFILYYSNTGNTGKMAEYIEKGAKEEGVDVIRKQIKKNPDKETINELIKHLEEADGIIIGSPTYYGSMVSCIKKLIDDSFRCHGELVGKVGAAFTSSAFIAGGNETTILDIIHAMLVHGMVIQGDCDTDHYGPAAIDEPDEHCLKTCERLGRRVAQLTRKLFS